MRALRFPALLLASLALAGCRDERPNLLVVSLDTTRADHLGAYGYAGAHTPAIDELAAGGFLFRRHLTPVPITLPSHTTILTGHLPPTHTVHDNGAFVVPEGEITLAELLRDAGYETAAFVGAFPLARRFGLDQGFDRYDDRFHVNPRDVFFDERPAGEVVAAAIEHHRRRDAGRPFFTFLHLFDPHQPQTPPAPWDVRFPDRPYDGEIAYADAQLGRFFAFLRERGEWERTLVVLTADHGEGLGEHGELTHAMLLHQATLHVPLVLHGPGVPHGETGEWTLSSQVFATVLERLGVAAPEPAVPVGKSLWPLIENGGEKPPGWPRFTAFFETIAPRTSAGWSQLAGWMKDDWRLVVGPRRTLYQLAVDPGESDDRRAAEPAIAAALAEELGEALRRLETRPVGAAVEDADPETLARLAALGYLQTSPETLRGFGDLLDVEGRIDPRDRVIDVSLLSEAKAAMARRQWPLAEGLWREVLARTPGQIAALRALAILAAQAGDWERAFAEIDAGLALHPGAPELRRFQGELLVETGRPGEGLAILLALPTGSVEARTWIGAAYQGLGDGEAAKTWFRRGLELDPENRYLRLYLANQLAADGEVAEAEATYRALIDRHPYFSLAFYNYGKLLFDRGERERARGLFERAARLAPGHEMTRLALAELGAAGPS